MPAILAAVLGYVLGACSVSFGIMLHDFIARRRERRVWKEALRRQAVVEQDRQRDELVHRLWTGRN